MEKIEICVTRITKDEESGRDIKEEIYSQILPAQDVDIRDIVRTFNYQKHGAIVPISIAGEKDTEVTIPGILP